MNVERLTYRHEDQHGNPTNHISPDPKFAYTRREEWGEKVAVRLAAYEDTGLEPQEIERIVDAYGRGHTLRTESAERLEIIREIPTGRLRELVEADQLIGKEIWAKENTFHMFWKDTGNVGRAGVQYVSILKNGDILLHTQTCAISFREIGKTVFLNRDSAEAALKGEQDG